MVSLKAIVWVGKILFITAAKSVFVCVRRSLACGFSWCDIVCLLSRRTCERTVEDFSSLNEKFHVLCFYSSFFHLMPVRKNVSVEKQRLLCCVCVTEAIIVCFCVWVVFLLWPVDISANELARNFNAGLEIILLL